jgi:hypothetical protein
VTVVKKTIGPTQSDVRNWHQRLLPLRSWVRFPVRPIPLVIVRATLSDDSVGFIRGLRFPPTYITNRPILSI